MREDLIGRAETDNRAVTLIPMSEAPPAIFRSKQAGAARVRLKQLRPKPHAVERSDMLVSLGLFWVRHPMCELIWLTDSVDLGGGKEFVETLSPYRRHRTRRRPRGPPPARSLARRRMTPPAPSTVKVLRSAAGCTQPA